MILNRLVYNFYIHWRLIDGSITEGFHIPGLTPTDADLEESYLATEYNIDSECNDGLKAKVYQIEDTCTMSDGGNKLGKWINYNETYPNTSSFISKDGIDYRTQKVRLIS